MAVVSSQEVPPPAPPANPAWGAPANPAFPQPLSPGYNPSNTATSPLGTAGNRPASSTSYAPALPALGTPTYGGQEPDGTGSATVPLPNNNANLAAGEAFGAAVTGPQQHPALVSPDMQYVNAFNASIATQRQAIDNQLAASTGALGANRDAAAKVVAALPNQFNGNFNQAVQTVNGEKQAANAGAGASAIGGNVNDKLVTAGLANTRQAGLDTVPLLNAGVTANYEQALTSLQNTAMNDQTQLASTQSAFDASMAQGTLQANASAESQASSENFSNEQRVAQDVFNLGTAQANGGLTPAQQVTVANDAANNAARQNYTSADNEVHAQTVGTKIAPLLSSINWQAASNAAQVTQLSTEIKNILVKAGVNNNHDVLQWLYENKYIPPSFAPPKLGS